MKKHEQIYAFAAINMDTSLAAHFFGGLGDYTRDFLVTELSQRLMRETSGCLGDAISLVIGGDD